jgi:hypothetical protein
MSSPAHFLWMPPDCPHEGGWRSRDARPLRSRGALPANGTHERLSDDSQPALARGGDFLNAAIAELRRLAGGGDGRSQAAAIGDHRLAPNRSGAGDGSC